MLQNCLHACEFARGVDEYLAAVRDENSISLLTEENLQPSNVQSAVYVGERGVLHRQPAIGAKNAAPLPRAGLFFSGGFFATPGAFRASGIAGHRSIGAVFIRGRVEQQVGFSLIRGQDYGTIFALFGSGK